MPTAIDSVPNETTTRSDPMAEPKCPSCDQPLGDEVDEKRISTPHAGAVVVIYCSKCGAALGAANVFDDPVR
jgi:C4-type Zn-finger protein